MIVLYLLLYSLLLLAFSAFRTNKCVHHFQQNGYNNEKYLKWLRTSSLAQKTDYENVLSVSLILMLATIAMVYVNPILMTLTFVLALVFMYLSFFMFDFRSKSDHVKLKLVYTNRVKRLIATLSVLHALTFGVALFLILGLLSLPSVIGALLIMQVTITNLPRLITLANSINKPMELHINNGFIKDAQRILKSNEHLTVIGITGSYGKTSVKNVLAAMLSQKYATLMTPESYNTPMGVVKTIRGSLKPYHEMFICEMGAYVPGEIKEICDIVHPDMSVITCIGTQHLDTFKTQENIIKTKSEIFFNTKPGGTVFVNLYDQYIRELKLQDNVEKIAFGEPGSYCYVQDSKITGKGTTLTIASESHGTFEITTKLLGRHNIENIMLCVAIALRLGVSPEQINRSLYDIQPVKHRLSYHKTEGGYTIIDDAFNSNPIGSKNAVEVLSIYEGNKKIIMTPGMIGLGDRQDELNEKFGEYIGKGVDYAVLVGDKQTAAIQKGIRSTGFPEERIIIKNSTKEAFDYVYSIIEKDDVLLIENDLPDIFNE